MEKIGIMGGTFNPIHYGHLFLAENAYEQIGLDQVLFMPSKNPPHKEKTDILPEWQRVDMISLAIKNNPHFRLSDLELRREGITYTADTVTILAREDLAKEYYFIVGADSLFMMQSWMKPQIIFKYCKVVAASRDHAEREELRRQIDFLKERYHADIILIEMPTIQISSAVIRERIAANKTIRYYLPDAVIDYIEKNQLYNY